MTRGRIYYSRRLGGVRIGVRSDIQTRTEPLAGDHDSRLADRGQIRHPDTRLGVRSDIQTRTEPLADDQVRYARPRRAKLPAQRAAVGGFGAARPCRGDAFESPSQGPQGPCFSPPRNKCKKATRGWPFLHLYPWRREGDSNPR